MKSTHSGRLERYLGAEKVAELSRLMRNEEYQWYGPPIALHGVPGAVYMTRDGDFIGECRAGWEMSLLDHATDLQRRVKRALRVCSERERSRLNAGFSSLSDLISEATLGGKKQDIFFNKAGAIGVAGVTNTLWFQGSMPPAGAAGSAAPGGRACDRTTTGALPFINPAVGGDQQHIVSSNTLASAAGMTLLLYDRIFDVNKTMNSTAAENVTGVPTRYQSTVATDKDYAGGNFLLIEVQTALAATAHNWTFSNTSETGASVSSPTITGNASAIAGRLDIPAQWWFTQLSSGTTGIKALTQMTCSALVATGAVTFAIGHPIAFIAHPLANQVMVMDYINTAFNLTRIYDNACLSLLEPTKSATTATTYSGQITLVAG